METSVDKIVTIFVILICFFFILWLKKLQDQWHLSEISVAKGKLEIVFFPSAQDHNFYDKNSHVSRDLLKLIPSCIRLFKADDACTIRGSRETCNLTRGGRP